MRVERRGPVGQTRRDNAHLLTAALYALMANVNRPKGGTITKLDDILPEWLKQKAEQSPECVLDGIRMAKRAANRESQRAKRNKTDANAPRKQRRR